MILLDYSANKTYPLPDAWVIREDLTARYYGVPEEKFESIIGDLKRAELILVCLFGVEDFLDFQGCSLLYVFEEKETAKFVVLLYRAAIPVSIATIFPLANLFEREIADGFGISFTGAYDTRRLFLHECYPDGFSPLQQSFSNTPLVRQEPLEPFQFREIEGTSVYQVPVGPVHAGIIEPGHFRFSVIGETIVNLEIRLGYLHRGIERLAEKKFPQDVVKVAESISGDESVAQACGFAMAVELISGCQVPKRAEYIRGILLELERAYSLLSDLAGMLTDVAFPVAAGRLLVLRENLQREADLLTGSRFMKGSICIGGVIRDISPKSLGSFFKTAGQVEQDLQEIISWVLTVPTVLDRFSTTGVIRPDLIDPLALSGPIARASGSTTDARVDHPYGIYHERAPARVCEAGGDVLARFTLKYQEILASLRYIQELILFVPEGEVGGSVRIIDGYGLIGVESGRGLALHWIYVRGGVIQRYKVRTASFSNWYVIEHAVIGNIVPDFPLINKSLNLSYAGTDL
ncbi:MAG TPA: NADH-quinone oxidoreductase subunit C [Methanospirillum sp.]|nr:NADH-quinone oxidoreductase subunit C [Methanospirillum sp.]